MGCCEVIISDQGRELVNKVKEELLQLSGMEHRVASAYHRQSNRISERFNLALQTALVKVVNDTQANRFSTTRTMLTPWYVCALALSISVWVCVWVGVQAPMSAVSFLLRFLLQEHLCQRVQEGGQDETLLEWSLQDPF